MKDIEQKAVDMHRNFFDKTQFAIDNGFFMKQFLWNMRQLSLDLNQSAVRWDCLAVKNVLIEKT